MPTSSDTETKPAGRGCLFYGCLSAVALFIVLLLAGYLTARYLVNTAIDNYTDDASQKFETVVISKADRDDLLKRVKEFDDAKGKTNQPVQLTLTSDEINALIAEDAELKDRVRVEFEDDEIVVRATIPLEAFSGMPFLGRLKGRHLNVSLQVGVALNDGKAEVSIVSAEVNGEPLPAEFLEQIENEASFKQMLNDPELRKQLDQLDWIKVEGGKLRVATGGSETESE